MQDAKTKITLSREVDSYRSGWTVVEYLSHRFKYHTQARWTERVNNGRVLVNGVPIGPEQIVHERDVVTYTIFHNEPDVDLRYDIIYEDDHLLAVAKSGNSPVHASGVFIRKTLIATLKNDIGDHVNLAHRLDRETSGIVLLSKDAATARALGEMFAKGRVSKKYTAVVYGHVAQDRFEVDAPIAKAAEPVELTDERLNVGDPASNLPRHVPRRCVDFDNGKPAKTLFEVVRHVDGFTVLTAVPLSGRTNQIRVHLEHAGYPIVGDKLYKGTTTHTADVGLNRQALHCGYLGFEHPATRRWMELQAEVPADMWAIILPEDR